MYRRISVDEICHRLRLISDDIVYAAMDQPGFDMRASVCAETLRNLWKQFCER
jgi:hypothetical protein